jgi:hypothetical protein
VLLRCWPQLENLDGFHVAYSFWEGMLEGVKKKIGELFCASKELRVCVLTWVAWD